MRIFDTDYSKFCINIIFKVSPLHSCYCRIYFTCWFRLPMIVGRWVSHATVFYLMNSSSNKCYIKNNKCFRMYWVSILNRGICSIFFWHLGYVMLIHTYSIHLYFWQVQRFVWNELRLIICYRHAEPNWYNLKSYFWLQHILTFSLLFIEN